MEFTKLHDQIWLVKQFMDEKDLTVLIQELDNLDESIWYGDQVSPDSYWYGRNMFYGDLSEAGQLIVKDAERRMVECFGNYERIHEIQSPLRSLNDGQSLGTHKDNSAPDDHNNMYGVVIYLNDSYEGGEIHYPELEYEYKPSAGDMVVHYAGLLHGAKPATGSTRYILTSFVKGDMSTTFLGDTL